MLDDRARILLKALIERYIADGQPVGSRTLSRQAGFDLSPATIRNVMADLEEMGFIISPHTSAGRIPTARGYRLFVDSLVTVQPIEQQRLATIQGQLAASVAPQQLVQSASKLLSGLTHFAGIVMVPKRAAPKIRQIEFLALGDKRVLLIIVTQDGEVQNRILLTERSYQQSQLVEAANFLNQHFAGCDFEQIRRRLREEIGQLQGDLSTLMSAALEASDEALAESASDCVISGERNLLDAEDLSSNIHRLKKLFDLFEQRTELLRLLDISDHAAGVQLFIGGEAGIATLDECSVVMAPYEVDGEVVGSLGVVGPTRMAYERVIPIVDITARLLSSAMGQQKQGG